MIPVGTRTPPFTLFGQKHPLAVSDAPVPFFCRRYAEIIENENPKRRRQRTVRRFACGHVSAHVMRRAEFATANFRQRIPNLRFKPDARPAAPDTDIAHHQYALSVGSQIFVRSWAIRKAGNHPNGPRRRCGARFITTPPHFKSKLLKFGLHAEIFVILAETSRRSFANHTPIFIHNSPPKSLPLPLEPLDTRYLTPRYSRAARLRVAQRRYKRSLPLQSGIWICRAFDCIRSRAN
jgi:hypothetical protein